MDLWTLERSLRGSAVLVCGVDEAGRGPLAGPVCAAAVLLPDGLELPGLNDSKKLTEKRREALFPLICEQATAWAVGWASEQEIDEVNILNATFLAMNRAIAGLGLQPELALIDGNRNSGIECPSLCVIGGDGKCASIAAASVLAKVSRDRYMLELAKQYPGYGFEQHKGYGTKFHCERILELGASSVHRQSFLTKLKGRN